MIWKDSVFSPFFPTLRSHEFHRMTQIIYKENAFQEAPLEINKTYFIFS